MSQLELGARPLRRDISRLVIPLLILPGLAFALVQAPAAAVLCPLLMGPWLWWRRERFWLDRCRVLVDGAALRVVYGERQLLALDLRYATRQFTGDGDLVLSEGDANYLALGVDPPEHGYQEPDGPAEGGAVAADSPPAAPDGAAPEGPRTGSWRAVRLWRPDFLRLCAHLAAVPTEEAPDEADVWSLLRALGSVGTTGRRVEAQLVRLGHADSAQARPSGLLTTLRERSLTPGPAGAAALRVLKAL